MTDFLLELRSEEIPARMQARARDDLARLFATELATAGLVAVETVTYATPRRLALIARGLPDATQAVREEVKGPRSSAPPQALEGFLRKTGLAREQLVERDGVFFAGVERPGRATADVLAAAIPAIVRAFPWPKSMRWGEASISTESLRWVRPLQGIVAIFGEEVIDCEVAGIRSGAATVGHRFLHPGPITFGGPSDYVEKLRACHVIVDQDERAAIIATGASMLAAKAGLTLVRDEGLLAENAGLTEWPVPLLGRFDEAFLSVPPEVIQLTARVNQKYFVCHDAEGRLANAFVCVANIDATDGGQRIVEGNRKVLAARLSDARFFYETDLKTPLEALTPKLEKIVFHEKLGTVADKVERVAKLARWLVEEGIVVDRAPAQAGAQGSGGQSNPGLPPARENQTSELAALAERAGQGVSTALDTNGSGGGLADLAERAARLCKADLVTGMVGEFPELQGVMGGYYAAAQGEDPRVAAAIRDHYKPVGQGDDVPTDPVTVAVSLADKLDTLIGFFGIDERPTGSKDPFALRRAALGAILLILRNDLRFDLTPVLFWREILHIEHIRFGDSAADRRAARALRRRRDRRLRPDTQQAKSLRRKVAFDLGVEAMEYIELVEFDARDSLPSFFADRLKVQQREAGVRHDLIDAVFALGGEDDLVRLLARVHALQAFVGTEDGANLLAGYKRAANILKKEGWEDRPATAPIPQTGEEDPLVEVDNPDFAEVVAEFARSERTARWGYEPEPAERALAEAIEDAEPRAIAAVEAEDFEGAMTALASLRAPIDAFFGEVTVNDPDPAKRARRLDLLARVRSAVHRVADFSKIEG
jgi:glycyl-tRNA synthetase beta chain